MNKKIKLGDDFTEDSEEIETHEEEEKENDTEDEESEDDEKENSASASDSENEDEEDDEESEEEEDEESEEDDDDEDSESEDDEKTDEEKKKELQGLSDQEEALNEGIEDLDSKIEKKRQSIVNKRKDRRGKRILVDKLDEHSQSDETEEEDISDIDTDTVTAIERVIKSKGYVKKDELVQSNYQDAHKSAEDKFFEDHSEYLPENDEGDVLYDALKEELSLYAPPKNPSKIKELFERAHAEVKRNNPTFFKDIKKSVKTSLKKKNRLDTSKSDKGGSGSGGKGSKSKSKEGTGLSKDDIRNLKDGGFTDEDIKEMS